MSEHFAGCPHVVRAKQFTPSWITSVLYPLADKEAQLFLAEEKPRPLIGRKLFCFPVADPTANSFEAAMTKLGGSISSRTQHANRIRSMAHGRSFSDTIILLNQFGEDVIILDDEKRAERAAEVSSVPIINVGDGWISQTLFNPYVAQKCPGEDQAVMGDSQRRLFVSSALLRIILGA